MKKILVSLALSLGCMTTTTIAMAAAPTFSAQQMAQTKITELSFKQVMRALYSGQMTDDYVHDEDLESLPHIGLGKPDKENERTVAVMHPVMPYKNIAGEMRYLVTIEKVQVDNDSGSLVACHACQATADLYSFKKLDTDLFQLVSKTSPKVKFSSNYGRIQFDNSSLTQGLQPLGINLIGSVFKNSDMSFGTITQWWDVLHLPEDDYINVYHLGDAGEENGGQYDEDSPLHYDYKVSYKVQTDNSRYYPIMLTFKGDKPTEDYESIEYVNHSIIKKFDPIKKEYK